MNVPPTIGLALSHDKALMVPLSTSLNLEDLHDILEVIVVDAHNARADAKRRQAKR